MTWDYAKTEYEKQAKKDPVWKLERLIYGLNEQDAFFIHEFINRLKVKLAAETSHDRRI